MAKEISEEFVDYDFPSSDEHYVFGDLGGAMFGMGDESSRPEMTDSEIAECIERIASEESGLEHLSTRIFNQKREGSCVANAVSMAVQLCQARELGESNVVQLSAMSLYKRIGRSPSSGARVSDGLFEAVKRGILPLDTPANRERYGDKVMRNTGFSSRYPADWEATARRFCVLEFHVIRSVAGIWSALCRREPVVVGREGHSICYTTPIVHKGRRAAQYANSWGEGWGFKDAGLGGWGVDTESQVRKSASWAVAIRSLVRRVPEQEV